jgi:hypothetical protein
MISFALLIGFSAFLIDLAWRSDSQLEVLKPIENQDYTAKQVRQKTSKTILIGAFNDRRMGILTSDSSLLYFAKKEGEGELLEEMEGVHLVFQEELSPQILLVLNAKTAKYSYGTRELIANDVVLARYKLPNNAYPKEPIAVDPFFKGAADRVFFIISKDGPLIRAERLKANIIP